MIRRCSPAVRALNTALQISSISSTETEYKFINLPSRDRDIKCVWANGGREQNHTLVCRIFLPCNIKAAGKVSRYVMFTEKITNYFFVPNAVTTTCRGRPRPWSEGFIPYILVSFMKVQLLRSVPEPGMLRWVHAGVEITPACSRFSS
jgi:hypothetical protein